MKIEPNKVIKTKPKMVKEGGYISELFTTFLFIGTLIQIYLTYGGNK
jgi:hypothetical protein